MNIIEQSWYNEFLIPTMLIDRGIERVKEVASFPIGEIPELFEKEFSSMCEFLAFDEGIRLPFFKILNNAVERKYVALLNTFEPKKVLHILTHEEAFSFLCLLGHRKTREILEASNLPSNIFNSLLKSVEEKNVDVFDRSLSKGDFSEFLKKLWMLRYVVLGINQPTTIMGYRVDRENRWISEHPCHFCFNRYTTKEWEFYKEIKIKTLAGIEVRPRKLSKEYRMAEKDDVLNKNILSSEDTIVSGKYYPAWIEGLKNNDSRYGQYNKDIELYDISSLTSRCADMIYGMLTAVGRTNTESVSSLFGVEKASIHYEEHDYFCDDIDDYLIYILFFTHRMLEIYRYVKDVLEKDEKDCLLSLMKHSVYTELCGEVINAVELEPTKLQKHFNSSDQPLSPPQDEKVAESEPSSDENDRNGDENKWTSNPDVTSDTEILSTTSKNEEKSGMMNEQPEATSTKIETEGTPKEECNYGYPSDLHNRKRLCNKTLIDEVCKKFLSKWFKNKIDDVPLIKYVFFEYGTPSTNKLIFTGDIKDLVSFLLFLNGSGTQKIWNYINLFIVKENGQPVLGNNPRSNVKERLYNVIDRVRQEIGQAIDRKLNKEEEEDLT